MHERIFAAHFVTISHFLNECDCEGKKVKFISSSFLDCLSFTSHHLFQFLSSSLRLSAQMHHPIQMKAADGESRNGEYTESSLSLSLFTTAFFLSEFFVLSLSFILSEFSVLFEFFSSLIALSLQLGSGTLLILGPLPH